MFKNVLHPTTGKLLFRYDPERELVEIAARRQPVTIDLAAYKEGSNGKSSAKTNQEARTWNGESSSTRP